MVFFNCYSRSGGGCTFDLCEHDVCVGFVIVIMLSCCESIHYFGYAEVEHCLASNITLDFCAASACVLH